jgi:hypothetical protein
MRGVWFGILAALLALVGAGCGNPTKPVKGVLTLDGQPFEGAAVVFSPAGESGSPAYGRTNKHGAFVLSTYKQGDGALPGDYRVVVSFQPTSDEARTLLKNFDGDKASPQERQQVMKKMMGLMGKYARDYAAGKTKPSPIPAVYGDFTKTPLRQRVPVEGKVVLDLHSKTP